MTIIDEFNIGGINCKIEDGDGLKSLLDRMADPNSDSQFFFDIPDCINDLINGDIIEVSQNKKINLKKCKTDIRFIINNTFNNIKANSSLLKREIIDSKNQVSFSINECNYYIFGVLIPRNIYNRISSKYLINLNGIKISKSIAPLNGTNSQDYYLTISIDSTDAQLKDRYFDLLTDIVIYIGNLYRKHNRLSISKFFKMFDLLNLKHN